jgi:hypothetical protein
MGPLAMHRQRFSVTESSIGTDIHQSFNIGRHISFEISLDFKFLLNDISDTNHFCLCQLVYFGVLMDGRLFENFIG